MSAFDLWPFTDVTSVEQRGDLEVLTGVAPDGCPVTITRVLPDAARDGELRRRFRDAVEAATRRTGGDDPPILWADTTTLVPWAATYDDPDRHGADLIGGIFETKDAAAEGRLLSHETMVGPQNAGEKSVPALDADSLPPDVLAGGQARPPAGYAPQPPPGDVRPGPQPGPQQGPQQGPQPRPQPAPQPVPQAYRPQPAPQPMHQSMPPMHQSMPQHAPRPAPGPGGPAAPVGPPPGGSGGSGGSGSGGSRTPLYVGIGVGVLVVVAIIGTVIGVSLTRGTDTSADPGVTPTDQVTASPTPSSSQLTGDPTPSTTPTPKIRSAGGRSVTGPSWGKGDKTYTFAYPALGWAWRGPHDVDCFLSKNSKVTRKVQCAKLGAAEGRKKTFTVIDSTCSGGSCSAGERAKLEKMPGLRSSLRSKNSTTKYVTSTCTLGGSSTKYYCEYLSYYYKDSKGRLTKHVAAYGVAPFSQENELKKTFNDIVAQAHTPA